MLTAADVSAVGQERYKERRGAPDRRLCLLLTQEYEDTSVEYVQMHPEYFQGCLNCILKNIKLATVT